MTCRGGAGPLKLCDLIPAIVVEQYDFQEIGAFPSEMRLTAAMPWGGIVFRRNVRPDETSSRQVCNSIDIWRQKLPIWPLRTEYDVKRLRFEQ